MPPAPRRQGCGHRRRLLELAHQEVGLVNKEPNKSRKYVDTISTYDCRKEECIGCVTQSFIYSFGLNERIQPVAGGLRPSLLF